ncbi:hypothetical protein RJ640_008032 [Escallonia rubra]|uniref:Nudix hydrolase domain-containing protein n=1 Tax=Escallonia rubra TaxID=112253 RepID=A0AA88U1U6_9ASTE|nr:hypothetical protein RJ640_008030 [Escallonia rubra]KAK2975932.1 hypothetical protein RJ640_008032 [Escallonia rubra]
MEGPGKFKVRFGRQLRVRSSMSTTSSNVVSESQVQQFERLLTGKDDVHGGVIVEMASEPIAPTVFTSLLRASLLHWKQQGKKGVWIKMPIELVNLVESAVKEGFFYHHAEAKYLMLVHWIPETANTLPANASHRVGIGAFVMNEKREDFDQQFSSDSNIVNALLLRALAVLVVQEKSGLFRGTGVWKFPTGVVDEGEDICDAAVREVKEETGIDAKFVEILAFRQSHKSFFEKSDLFFMCMLQPLSFDIQKQESEIEAAEWMPFDDYAAQPFIRTNELLKYLIDICLAKESGEYTGFTPVPTVTSFSNNKSNLYLNMRGLNHPKI